MKVIETLWFTNKDGCIGIVVIKEDGDRTAYIGIASGADEKTDTESLLDWGSKFSLDTVLRLHHLLSKKKVKDEPRAQVEVRSPL